jgi:enamine deaminase RidA (YjgF/YER057c/UK114 family)
MKHVIPHADVRDRRTKWEEVARVHGEVFADIRPATSILEVAELIDKDALIEIEADAIVP